MVAFGLYYQMNCIILLIKLPNYVRNLRDWLFYSKIILSDWSHNWLIIKIVSFLWSGSATWIILIKMMSDKNVINPIVWFMTISFVVNFGFLWRKNPQAFDFFHFRFPFFEIGKIIQLIDNPIKNDDIVTFQFIKFFYFLLFTIIVDFTLLIFFDFIPFSSTYILELINYGLWYESFMNFIVRWVSEPYYHLSLQDIFFDFFYWSFTIFRRNELKCHHFVENRQRQLNR